jgi:hypothetical protein
MSRTLETISTVNSAARTFLALVVCGSMGTGGYYAYNLFHAQELKARKAETDLLEAQTEVANAKKTIASQELELQQKQVLLQLKQQQIAKLETSLRLLKIDHRLAKLNVLDQTTNADGQVISQLEFIELNDEGQPLGPPQSFKVAGEQIYIDGLVVKFEDKYVEQADLERATSLFVFKRIYSDAQNPRDGFAIDDVGAQPLAYSRGSQPSDLEKRIWADFWSIANNEAKAKELGIRAAHGQAVSIKPEKGASYRLELRASDGLTIRPDGRAPTSVFRPGA